MEDLIGEDLGGKGLAAGGLDLGGDVIGEGGGGLGIGPDAVAAGEPGLEDALQHRPIEPLLGAEVVVDIGLGQPGLGGDHGGGGAGEAGLGEDLLGGGQDARLAVAAPARPPVGGRWRQRPRAASLGPLGLHDVPGIPHDKVDHLVRLSLAFASKPRLDPPRPRGERIARASTGTADEQVTRSRQRRRMPRRTSRRGAWRRRSTTRISAISRRRSAAPRRWSIPAAAISATTRPASRPAPPASTFPASSARSRPAM